MGNTYGDSHISNVYSSGNQELKELFLMLIMYISYCRNIVTILLKERGSSVPLWTTMVPKYHNSTIRYSTSQPFILQTII